MAVDHGRAFARAGGRRLARLSAHLRRSSVQSVARDQPPHRRAAASRLGVHGARQQPLGRDADRRERRSCTSPRAAAACSRSTPSPASSSGRTCARIPQDIASSEAYPRHRGVAVYGDVVYFPTADSFLVALDARTGAKLWEVQTGDYKTGEGHAHAPLIADGKVFLGTTGGDFAARGKFEAYDAANGTKLWTFYTAPRKGEPGFETWTENEKWPPLGAAAWNTASYDAELELVYFSTGQPTPWTHGVARPRRLAVLEHAARRRGRHRQAALALPARARRRVGPLGVRGHARRFASRRRRSARP